MDQCLDRETFRAFDLHFNARVPFLHGCLKISGQSSSFPDGFDRLPIWTGRSYLEFQYCS
jgi:hypothetical protein